MGCGLDNRIVSEINILSFIIVLWICKRMSWFLIWYFLVFTRKNVSNLS